MQRGEVWWATRPPAKRRPVLLLSWDTHGNWRSRVTVADITTVIRGLDAEVPLTRRDGMSQRCAVNLGSLATIPRDLLRTRITMLRPSRMAEVNRAIHLALGLPLPCQVA
jgi:mRNA interferase MazF